MSTQRIKRLIHEVAQSEVPTDCDLWPTIAKRLEAPVNTTHGIKAHIGTMRRLSHRRSRSTLAGTVLAVLLLCGVVSSVPPSRAWAQTTLDDLLSYFNFSRTPSTLPQPMGSSSPPERVSSADGSPLSQALNCSYLNDGSSVCSEGQAHVTPAQAADWVGFAVKVPTYLPPDYQPINGLEVNPSATVVSWTAVKQVIGADDMCSERDIQLSQALIANIPDRTSSIGSASAVAVTIDGSAGLLIENTVPTQCMSYASNGIQQPAVAWHTNELVWERGGVRYALVIDAGAGREEAVKVAASLR